MLRLIVRLLWLLFAVPLVLLFGVVAYALKRYDISARIAQIYFTYAAYVMGLRVHVKGSVISARPLLLVSNHISYLDILAIGSAAPVIFTPKAEISRWPIVGFLCKLMGCVFIERKKSKTAENLGAIENALTRGIPLVLFAEGTTSDSKRILPIRSSYFNMVEAPLPSGEPLHIQPILIEYTRVHNLPMDMDSRHQIAWYGDMELLPHVKQLLRIGPIDVNVNFLPEIDLTNCKTRKEVAATIEQILVTARDNLH